MENLETAPVPLHFKLQQRGKEIDAVAVPPEWSVQIVKDPALEYTPEFVGGVQVAADTASFKLYFSRFSNDRTLVVATRKSSNIVAYLDYHRDAINPGPNKHSLHRRLVLDRRFKRWKELNGRSMTQIAFAEFMEDRLSDVISPDQAELLRSIVQFKANRNTTCASAIDLNGGDAKFTFVQESRGDAGQAVMPEKIQIKLPIYEFEREFVIGARLRYTLAEGKLTFKFDLIEVDDAEDVAFRTAVTDLSAVIDKNILLQD